MEYGLLPAELVCPKEKADSGRRSIYCALAIRLRRKLIRRQVSGSPPGGQGADLKQNP
jgi:hypothetical protein